VTGVVAGAPGPSDGTGTDRNRSARFAFDAFVTAVNDA